MSETQKQIDNPEIQGISDTLAKLDGEYNTNSAKLSRKLLSVEEKIEELKSNESINQKYDDVLRWLQNELEDLREDWNIENKNNELHSLVHNNVDNINMPKWHLVEYEGKIWDNEFIITRDKQSWENKLLINTNWVESEIKINSFSRYRDWWTTIIKTDIWEFYFPTPFKENAISTFTNNDWLKTNIETWEEINILKELNNVTWTDLFTKNWELFKKIHNDFYNENIVNDEVLNKFKSKIRDYVEKNWYELKEWFQVKADNQWHFSIQPEFLEKTPDDNYEIELQLWFG